MATKPERANVDNCAPVDAVAAAITAAAEGLRRTADALEATSSALRIPALSPAVETKDDDDYKVDANRNVKEALGFLKDWVTALIGLQTFAIGAIGTVVGLRLGPVASAARGSGLLLGLLPPAWVAPLTLISSLLVCATIIAFAVSIYCGSHVLNILPGAAQRIPHVGKDVYDIWTYRSGTGRFTRIEQWATWHRRGFNVGIVTFTVFVVMRILTVGSSV